MKKHEKKRKRRLAAGILLKDLASKIGVDTATLWRWEQGRNNPIRVLEGLWDAALDAAEGKK